MIEQIDAFAAQNSVDRSVAVRSLLAIALGEPAKVAAAREVMLILSQQRKFALSKFNDALQNVIDNLRQTVERGS